MKKVIALLLALAIAFALCGCGGSEPEPTPVPTPELQIWELDKMVDDFGDEIDKTYLRKIFTGTFSNTATMNSDLTAIVFMTPAVSNEEMISSFAFRLLEYNDTPATYTSGDELVIKVKVGDTIYTDQLEGSVPNGDLKLNNGLNHYSEVYKHIYNTMLKEEDVRCIIEVGSSEYNFTIEGAGFVNTANNMMKTYGYDQFDVSKYPVE